MIESWEFTSNVSAGTDLLMDALMLGLRNIVKSYGTDYILQVARHRRKIEWKVFQKVKANYLTGIKHYAIISKMPRSGVASLSKWTTPKLASKY